LAAVFGLTVFSGLALVVLGAAGLGLGAALGALGAAVLALSFLGVALLRFGALPGLVVLVALGLGLLGPIALTGVFALALLVLARLAGVFAFAALVGALAAFLGLALGVLGFAALRADLAKLVGDLLRGLGDLVLLLLKRGLLGAPDLGGRLHDLLIVDDLLKVLQELLEPLALFAELVGAAVFTQRVEDAAEILCELQRFLRGVFQLADTTQVFLLEEVNELIKLS